MRNFAALALCDLPDGLAVDGLDLLAIEFELNFCHSAASPARVPQKWTPVLRLEHAQNFRYEHFLAANRFTLCRKTLMARILPGNI
jgi:hypothetical protein